ncbi:ParB/RepB/Spo0J family partition protein [Methylobacterium nodulans]|uniref:ParB domain protein nuclease n=1 Tax=Methylobacterium nodulans (strain LMG 21967 / CNCM I-2342 / ORS 2060) TaxID=460265 RepID=B8IVJ4_METNO|nr:ParB/RepB/Spo0J family partition protein [Methylobacterium nodulans]ACL62434.1 ParB domain protein nuclease [Methylobacterium nodulans ORS 2060]
MAASKKITLASARTIPFDKLVLSQANVRRISHGQTIEQLAEDIAHRGLLQSLCVRPVLDADGAETSLFEVPAGGRRFRALERLVKTRRMTKTAPVPCIVREPGSAISAEEDSLAENAMREQLHPLDQFRAFKALIEAGLSEEDVAARFFVTVTIVKQRLKLASVSETLLAAYAAEEMTLQQLMAFTVSPDHAQQEQVWDAIRQQRYPAPAYTIRQMLTREQVPSSDPRAQFVGTEAYEAAGGSVIRDLFSEEGEGWFKDPALLDRLATEKLQLLAAEVRAEGWKWVEVALHFPYGHKNGLSRVFPEPVLTDEETAARDALRAEYDDLEQQHAGDGDLPEEVDARLAELERAIEAFDARAFRYAPADIAIAGAFVSLDHDGELRIERGYVRLGDLPIESPAAPEGDAAGVPEGETPAVQCVVFTIGGAPQGTEPAPEPDEAETDRPLTERHMMELTTYRTLALREALADDPDAAFLAVLHAMVLRVFHLSGDSCLEITTRSTSPDRSVEGLATFGPATALQSRRDLWAGQLPRQSAALWDFLLGLDADSRASLFALCAGLSVNAMQLPHDSRPAAIAHGHRVAELVGLAMARHWEPTAANFFGKVTKSRILSAVREARGEQAAQLIDHLKKADMAREAERLLAGSGWLPQPLRTPGLDRGALPAADMDHERGTAASEPEARPEALPAFLAAEDGTDPEVGDRGSYAVAAE